MSVTPSGHDEEWKKSKFILKPKCLRTVSAQAMSVTLPCARPDLVTYVLLCCCSLSVRQLRFSFRIRIEERSSADLVTRSGL